MLSPYYCITRCIRLVGDGKAFLLITRKSSSAFYLDSGNEGPGKDDEMETIGVRESMERLGKKINTNLFYYLDDGGSHNELFWGKRFFRPMIDFYHEEGRNKKIYK